MFRLLVPRVSNHIATRTRLLSAPLPTIHLQKRFFGDSGVGSHSGDNSSHSNLSRSDSCSYATIHVPDSNHLAYPPSSYHHPSDQFRISHVHTTFIPDPQTPGENIYEHGEIGAYIGAIGCAVITAGALVFRVAKQALENSTEQDNKDSSNNDNPRKAADWPIIISSAGFLIVYGALLGGFVCAAGGVVGFVTGGGVGIYVGALRNFPKLTLASTGLTTAGVFSYRNKLLLEEEKNHLETSGHHPRLQPGGSRT